MAKRVEKKAWPDLFEEVLSGRKKFDLRLNDFDIEEGDTFVLREWDPEKREYAGREVEKKVGYILKFKLGEIEFWPKEEIDKYGFQLISLD